METIQATKKDLNKVIRWSSSKFNEYKKSEVVERIIFLVEIGEDTTERFGTGSYSERGHLCGWDYILNIKDGIATLTQEATTITVYRIEKPKNSRYYTGAKRFKVVGEKFNWHKEIVGQEFDVISETKSSYYFEVTLDGEVRRMCIDKTLVQVME